MVIRPVVVSGLVLLAFAGCQKDKLKGPAAEVKKSDVKLNLPAVPGFELPAAGADGSHSVKEMRVKGKKLLDQEVTVKGYVTWVYDCAQTIKQPGQSDADVAKMIEEDPSRCERMKFYLGDSKDTPAEKSIWITDIPRPFNKIDRQNLTADEIKYPAADRCDPTAKVPTCVKVAVGDEMEITGKWSLTSQHGERNSEGLLSYVKLKNVTQSWETPPPVVNPALAGTPQPTKEAPKH